MVSFTSNIGLAKPTETELATDWINGQKYYEDNILILEDKTDVEFHTYTPALIGSAGNPSVGAGSIKGEYQSVGNFCFGTVVISFIDPGVAAGSGVWGVSLPFVADSSFHSVAATLQAGADTPGKASCIGEAQLVDSSSVANSGSAAVDVATVSGTSYMRMVLETFTGKTGNLMSATQPFVVATGDRMALSFAYKF